MCVPMHQDIWISFCLFPCESHAQSRSNGVSVILYFIDILLHLEFLPILQHVRIPSFVSSCYSTNLSQDSHLKGFQLSFLIFFYSPALRVIQEQSTGPLTNIEVLSLTCWYPIAFQMLCRFLIMPAAMPILLSTSLSQKPSAPTTPPRYTNSSHCNPL